MRISSFNINFELLRFRIRNGIWYWVDDNDKPIVIPIQGRFEFVTCKTQQQCDIFAQKFKSEADFVGGP